VAQAHDEGTTETPQKAAAKTAEGAPKTAPDSKTSTDPGSKDTADKTKSAGSGQDGKSAPAKANKRTSKASARTHAS
ncbi:MAG: hypothetical protein KAI47_09370, partial [Deltaproteobacteria bacterium]|nr:hypothetical protein [Deltaproteobacteria bacterium]